MDICDSVADILAETNTVIRIFIDSERRMTLRCHGIPDESVEEINTEFNFIVQECHDNYNCDTQNNENYYSEDLDWTKPLHGIASCLVLGSRLLCCLGGFEVVDECPYYSQGVSFSFGVFDGSAASLLNPQERSFWKLQDRTALARIQSESDRKQLAEAVRGAVQRKYSGNELQPSAEQVRLEVQAWLDSLPGPEQLPAYAIGSVQKAKSVFRQCQECRDGGFGADECEECYYLVWPLTLVQFQSTPGLSVEQRLGYIVHCEYPEEWLGIVAEVFEYRVKCHGSYISLTSTVLLEKIKEMTSQMNAQIKNLEKMQVKKVDFDLIEVQPVSLMSKAFIADAYMDKDAPGWQKVSLMGIGVDLKKVAVPHPGIESQINFKGIVRENDANTVSVLKIYSDTVEDADQQ